MRENDRLIKYFNAQARLGMSMQHPGGIIATNRLVGFFPPLKDASRILEIGCGAGRTAGLLLDRFPCSYIGIDASPAMLKRARAFLMPYRSRVALLQLDLREKKLPFSDSSFDVVFAESVFAILDASQIIPECSRVLKPEGMLAWNDRIWGNRLPVEIQKRINGLSLSSVGFHAAPLDLSNETDWQHLAEGCGLRILVCEKLEGMPKDPFLSALFRRMKIIACMLKHPTGVSTCMSNTYV